MTSLNLSGVGVAYGTRNALNDFTDSVKPGEWLCLIGPNGAGKSSLLRSIAGLVKHSGEIRVDGSP
jgi:ABC-type multidrug transport system ATPase subunit